MANVNLNNSIPNVGQTMILLKSKKANPQDGFQAGQSVVIMAREYHVPGTDQATGQLMTRCNQAQVPRGPLAVTEQALNAIFYKIGVPGYSIVYGDPDTTSKNLPPIPHSSLSAVKGGQAPTLFFTPGVDAFLIRPYEAQWTNYQLRTATTDKFRLPPGTKVHIVQMGSWNPTTGRVGHISTTNTSRVPEAHYTFMHYPEERKEVVKPLGYLVTRDELQIAQGN